MGYANNEPLLLQKSGMTVHTFDVNNAEHPLVSNGLAAMESVLKARGGDIKKLVAATLKGVEYVMAASAGRCEPEQIVRAGTRCRLAATDALAVLQATLPYLQMDSAKAGYNDPAKWTGMVSFLQAQGQLAAPVDASKVYSNDYLP